MLFDDTKEIYIQSEQKLLAVFSPDRKPKAGYFAEVMRNILAPLRVFLFAVFSTNGWIFILRFVVYLTVSFVIYSLILHLFKGVISDLFLFFSFALTLFIPSLFSIIAPPSDASFFRVRNSQVKAVIEIIKRKGQRENTAMKEYLSGLKENFQIIEKYVARRNLLLKSLLAAIYLAGAYFVSTADKVSGGDSSFLLFSLVCFFGFFLFVESHTIFKDQVFAVLFSAITEINLEIKEMSLLENSQSNSKEINQ